MSFRSSSLLPALLVAALAFVPAPLLAQSVAGKWLIEYIGRARIENGVMSGEKVKAQLDLAQAGDSVTGTWTMLDGSAPAWKVRGTVKGNQLVLESEPTDATINLNGDERVVSMVRTLELTVNGDALTGEMSADGEGLPRRPPPRDVTGRRAS